MTNRRRAFTLVELLVVISIIGILLGIVLPAVQSIREAARNVQCKNNLIQMGLAAHNYVSSNRHFPPAMVQDQNIVLYNQLPPPDNRLSFSWLARILPFLEQDNVFNNVQWNEWAWPNPYQVLSSPDDYFNGIVINTYQCPSDLNAGKTKIWLMQIGQGGPIVDVQVAFTSYLGVSGTDQFMMDGMLHVNSRVRMAQITDGTSNTLLAGERPATFDLQGGWWLAGSGPFPWYGAIDVVCGSEERIANVVGGSWECRPDGPQSFYQPGGYTTDLDGVGGYYKHAWHFWSAHPTGANFVFADGHVDFLPYTIGRDLFTALATKASGEIIGPVQ